MINPHLTSAERLVYAVAFVASLRDREYQDGEAARNAAAYDAWRAVKSLRFVILHEDDPAEHAAMYHAFTRGT